MHHSLSPPANSTTRIRGRMACPFVPRSAIPLPSCHMVSNKMNLSSCRGDISKFSGRLGNKPFFSRSVLLHRNLLCGRVEREGSLASFDPSGSHRIFSLGGGSGNHATTSSNGRSNETFQQLRQAVLSSLDFSENTEATQDWDDWDESNGEDAAIEPQTSAVQAGKAVFEVQRIDKQGKSRRVYVRRRDLIRTYNLQPRDLRRIDPSLSPTKTSPSVAIKEECVLVNIGGIRTIITADKCLLFEPSSSHSRKFMEMVVPKLQSSAAAERARSRGYMSDANALESVTMSIDGYTSGNEAFDDARVFPFELEILEGALIVATGKLEAELVAATRRVGAVLRKLPREITPVNLEELRRVKQLLVELESKAENLRDMLTELMDDEDEVIELNLSSRPVREEKRRQRERERIEREMERELTERGLSMRIVDGLPATEPQALAALKNSPSTLGISSTTITPKNTLGVADTATSVGSPFYTSGNNAGSGMMQSNLQQQSLGNASSLHQDDRVPPATTNQQQQDDDGAVGQAQDALDDALEEIADKEEEERELEEVEDLLEYYLQRASTTQSEAERLLAGARDLEESIGVSLSARRFEVNRLELMLSIASFAAALGAMVASIFGMNLRSTLEMSVIGFWGTTMAIVAGSCWVFWVLYKYTKSKRIL